VLESISDGPLPFLATDALPLGKGWNTKEHFAAGKEFARWACELQDCRLASGIEIPYANARGQEVNQTSASAFGIALAKAICLYLKNSE